MPAPRHTPPARIIQRLLLTAVLTVTELFTTLRRRWDMLHARGDQGSISVEKAVITAIALALALGLMAAIAAVVNKYQGQIR